MRWLTVRLPRLPTNRRTWLCRRRRRRYRRCGAAAVFSGLPSPLRAILGWRCSALQAAAERLSERLPRVVVERFSALFVPDLFASDGFHPNARAHGLWGEEIAALPLPLLRAGAQPTVVPPSARRLGLFETDGVNDHPRSNAHR